MTRRLVAPAVDEVDGVRFDYSDVFEVVADHADHRSAEQWARVALEQSPAALRWLIVHVHRRLLGFRLGPLNAADHVLGWRIVRSAPDIICLTAAGPLMRGELVGRRTAPTATELTTYLQFERRLGRRIWVAVGPLHRRIAPYLLRRAAAVRQERPT